ncbi:MAG: hypothetical protein JKY65_03335 [Planctomycetes bacterium]|nr:hypothetical protein [Planctomycetota bacterium]
MKTPPPLAFCSELLSDYGTFMPDPEGQRLAKAAEGTRFQAHTDELIAAWRMASYARAMPWVMAHSMPGAVRAALANSRVVSAVLASAQAKIHTLGLGREDAARVVDLLQRLGQSEQAARHEALAQDPPKQMLQASWRSLLQEEAMRMALHASEQQAFSSLYFSYENFLGRLIEELTSKWLFRTPDLLKALGCS